MPTTRTLGEAKRCMSGLGAILVILSHGEIEDKFRKKVNQLTAQIYVDSIDWRPYRCHPPDDTILSEKASSLLNELEMIMEDHFQKTVRIVSE